MIEVDFKFDVVNFFGYWPQFCDARIDGFLYDFDNNKLELVLFYSDNDTGKSAKVTFSLEGISDIKIENMLTANLVDSVVVNMVESFYIIDIESCYGLYGRIEVEKLFVYCEPLK